jgi:hypothetical protein
MVVRNYAILSGLSLINLRMASGWLHLSTATGISRSIENNEKQRGRKKKKKKRKKGKENKKDGLERLTFGQAPCVAYFLSFGQVVLDRCATTDSPGFRRL